MITDVMNSNKTDADYGRRKKRVHSMTNDNPKYDYVPDKNYDTYNPYGRMPKKLRRVISIDMEA
jgi:hypothetical protein